MAITVSDIEQKEFAFKGAGYDPYDVDQYLDQICDEMVAMQDRIDALEAQLKQAQQEAEAAKNAVRPAPVAEPAPVSEPEKPSSADSVAKASETLESILLNAQRLGDEAVENAKRRAEEMVAEAEKKAASIVDDSKEEKAALLKEVETMRTAAGEYRTKFLALLKDQQELLESDPSLFDEKND